MHKGPWGFAAASARYVALSALEYLRCGVEAESGHHRDVMIDATLGFDFRLLGRYNSAFGPKGLEFSHGFELAMVCFRQRPQDFIGVRAKSALCSKLLFLCHEFQPPKTCQKVQIISSCVLRI